MHTKGPWVESNLSLWTPEHETSGNNVWTVIRSEEADQDVAIVMQANAGWRDTPELDANARLIAAAPMLLEAAVLALKIAEGWIDDRLAGTSSYAEALAELEPVRAAIAAARQESAS